MIITSEVLGLYGQASGLGEPETNDAVLSVPPLVMPTTKLYRPCTALHAGFLATGMATTSFFYGDVFHFTNVPASDTITVVLGKGIWEISIVIACTKNYGSASILADFFGVSISYDEGSTMAFLWRNHIIDPNKDLTAVLQTHRVTSTGVVGTRVSYFIHSPLSGVGQNSLATISITGLRLF